MGDIVLSFDKLVTNLAGNRFGRKTYAEQVKAHINTEEKNYIILPDQIEDIASSFIQGFYSEISEVYGKGKALQVLELKSANPYVIEKIRESIETYGV